MPVTALIVDDSPFARKLIRHHLERYGCRVVGEAENGIQAIAMFNQLNPDLVTMDLMMPAIEGVDSLTAFRAMRSANPRAAILVVSAIPFNKTRDIYLAEGALGYIIKPFTKYSLDQVRLRLGRVFPELHLA